ncbi:MAG: nucleotidyltransferase family protein [Planctomycetota bacterium]
MTGTTGRRYHTLILAAGFDERLYPLTRDVPKPLLPIAGRPLLEWTLDRLLASSRLGDITVLVNERDGDTFVRWRETGASGRVRVLPNGINDPHDARGAVSDALYAIRQIPVRDDLFLVAGDNLFDFPVDPFLDFHEDRRACSVILKDLGRRDLATEYGQVELGDRGRIVRFVEKPVRPRGTLVAAGMYLFPRDSFPLVEAFAEEAGVGQKPGRLIEWLYKKTPVFGCIPDGDWYDIGDIDSYNRADKAFAARVRRG